MGSRDPIQRQESEAVTHDWMPNFLSMTMRCRRCHRVEVFAKFMDIDEPSDIPLCLGGERLPPIRDRMLMASHDREYARRHALPTSEQVLSSGVEHSVQAYRHPRTRVEISVGYDDPCGDDVGGYP